MNAKYDDYMKEKKKKEEEKKRENAVKYKM